ncbi:VOC family protein [uncultured Amnibacterium sp.]|uniref:VOC family protein n=1 Tax=uncultured Amnibacterium sp. TaxID=1631851 RepID=UPI0035CABF03
MPISLRYSPITVSDPEAALAFYRDALGLPVAQDVASGGQRWITLGEADGAQIVLSGPEAGRSPADGEALEELVVKGVLGPWVFATDDLTGLFDRAVAAGADVVSEPADQPWGPRDAAFRDPSGNVVRVLQS